MKQILCIENYTKDMQLSNLARTLLFSITALCLSLLFNYLLILVWKKYKITILRAAVRNDRWGAHHIQLTGGIVIVTIFVGYFILSLYTLPISFQFKIAVIGSIAIFILGLLDDVLNLKSYQKLLGQIVVTLVILMFGIRVQIFGNFLDIILTFIWIVGITNSINLLDNMDGLAGGISCIALAFLGVNYLQEGNITYFLFCTVLASLTIGFLIFNFKPAKVYLGDSGALFIGFFMAVLIALGTNSEIQGKSLIGVLVFPVILLMIPIFDTTFVSITRRIRKQSFFRGGKDHISHRLVQLGMSERGAVITLYIISSLLGLLFFILREVKLIPSIILYFLISVAIILFGIYIGRLKIGEEKENDEYIKKSVKITGNILFKKQILMIVLDIFLLGLIYYLSYLIRFGGEIDKNDFIIFLQSIPFVILIKTILLNLFKTYTIDVRYFSFSDAMKILKSMTLSTFTAVLIFTFWTRFQGYSRAVFVIDWLLSLAVLGGIRVFYRLFDYLFYPLKVDKMDKIAYVGDIKNFKAIEFLLRIKNIDKYHMKKIIDIDAINENDEEFENVLSNIDILIFEEEKVENVEKMIKNKRIKTISLMKFIEEIIYSRREK